MMNILRTCLMLALLMGAASPVLAGPLDDAKAQGLVGERVDGYLGIVPGSVPPAVQDLVEDINAKRRQKYGQVAQERGVAIDAVAAIAGQKLVDRAASGQFVAGPAGNWRRK